MRHTPALLLSLATLAALALPPSEAQAQRYSGGRPGQALSGVGGTIDSSRRPPPAALPGLAARGTVEPIPADPNQNLAPTPQLFDAISRGDLASARDAVARGADPDARNVLGLTPLDAAVDQGRNDIMFFLLSVRGGRPSGPSTDEATRSAFHTQPPVPPGRAAARTGRGAPTALTNETRATPVAEALAPRLWAGNGGAPKPELGFLGFDAGRPAGAAPPPGEQAPASPRRNRG